MIIIKRSRSGPSFLEIEIFNLWALKCIFGIHKLSVKNHGENLLRSLKNFCAPKILFFSILIRKINCKSMIYLCSRSLMWKIKEGCYSHTINRILTRKYWGTLKYGRYFLNYNTNKNVVLAKPFCILIETKKNFHFNSKNLFSTWINSVTKTDCSQSVC